MERLLPDLPAVGLTDRGAGGPRHGNELDARGPRRTGAGTVGTDAQGRCRLLDGAGRLLGIAERAPAGFCIPSSCWCKILSRWNCRLSNERRSGAAHPAHVPGPCVEVQQWHSPRIARPKSSAATRPTPPTPAPRKCRSRSSASASTTSPNISRPTRRIITRAAGSSSSSGSAAACSTT